MASMVSLKKLTNIDGGIIGNVVDGLGVGTLINVADKKFLGGKLTTTGFPLGGRTINGKPLTLNITDAATAFVVTKGKFSTKYIVPIIAAVGVKKYFEAYDYIDPYQPPGVSNATVAAQTMAMLPQSYYPPAAQSRSMIS